MDVTPLIPMERKIIQSYSSGGFKVSGVFYSGGVLVFPDKVQNWHSPQNFEDLSENDFAYVLEDKDNIDVVLLGCGAKALFLNPFLRQAIKAKGLNIDVMDSGAACRTYNVLMAEGRRVAALLMPSL